MTAFVLGPTEDPLKFEAGNKHFSFLDHSPDKESPLTNVLVRVGQALRNGASRLWHWCKSVVVQSSPRYRARELDEEMLNLMKTENTLTSILAKTEKALENAHPSTHTEPPPRTVTFLQTIKTKIEGGLDAVYQQRMDAFNRLPLSDITFTRI